jgi:hypothetical protein
MNQTKVILKESYAKHLPWLLLSFFGAIGCLVGVFGNPQSAAELPFMVNLAGSILFGIFFLMRLWLLVRPARIIIDDASIWFRSAHTGEAWLTHKSDRGNELGLWFPLLYQYLGVKRNIKIKKSDISQLALSRSGGKGRDYIGLRLFVNGQAEPVVRASLNYLSRWSSYRKFGIIQTALQGSQTAVPATDAQKVDLLAKNLERAGRSEYSIPLLRAYVAALQLTGRGVHNLSDNDTDFAADQALIKKLQTHKPDLNYDDILALHEAYIPVLNLSNE